MDPMRGMAGVWMLLGAVTLYVAWANAVGFLGPHPLCAIIGGRTPHIGGNLAVVYTGKCGPYEGAYELFALLTTAGLGLVGGGRYVERRRRSAVDRS